MYNIAELQDKISKFLGGRRGAVALKTTVMILELNIPLKPWKNKISYPTRHSVKLICFFQAFAGGGNWKELLQSNLNRLNISQFVFVACTAGCPESKRKKYIHLNKLNTCSFECAIL